MIHMLGAIAVLGAGYAVLGRRIAEGRLLSSRELFRRGVIVGFFAAFVAALPLAPVWYALAAAIPNALLLGWLFQKAPEAQSALINRLPQQRRDQALETRKRAMERRRRRSSYFGP
jgi:membrane protein implicated in regulation of membrane protease activity